MPYPYVEGVENTLTATFRNADGDLFDPDAINLTYGHIDDDTPATTDYPADGDIVRISLGVFELLFTPDAPGTWFALWVGTGPEGATVDQTFLVTAANLPLATYASLPEFKHWLESDPHDPQNTLDDDLLTWCLQAATDDINKATGRTFSAVTEARYYGSRDGSDLVIHDLTALSEIATDEDGDGTYETVWIATDYLLDPPNAINEGDAYTRIRAAGQRRFPLTLRGAKVTGTFGLTVGGSAPALIKLATMVGANRWLHRRSTPLGTETVPDMQGGATVRQIKADYDYDRAIKRYARGDSVDIVLPVVVPIRPTLFTLAPGYRGR